MIVKMLIMLICPSIDVQYVCLCVKICPISNDDNTFMYLCSCSCMHRHIFQYIDIFLKRKLAKTFFKTIESGGF